jgi:hypothetical protein
VGYCTGPRIRVNGKLICYRGTQYHFLTGRRAKGFNPFSPKGWDVTAPASGGGRGAGLPTFLSYPFSLKG